MRSPRRRGTHVLSVLAAVGALALAPAGAASAAGGTGTDSAYIRVGHLIPGFGGVTMAATLTSFDGSTKPMQLAPRATYGTLSAYQSLPTGYYSIAVRPLGAAPDSPPVLTGTLTAQPGDAYTVTGLGDSTRPRLSAIQDDITPPTPGTARVRVLPVARPDATTDVTVPSGPALAQGAAFSQATGYTVVPAGNTALHVTTGGVSAEETTQLAGGSVYTLLVLDDGHGGLEVRPVADASGAGVTPRGGADTGAGGLADEPDAEVRSPALAVGGGVLAVAGGGALVVLRRRSSASSASSGR